MKKEGSAISALTTLQPGPASYGFFIGRLGGNAFSGRPGAAFLVAIAISRALSGLGEAVRRIRLHQVRRER